MYAIHSSYLPLPRLYNYLPLFTLHIYIHGYQRFNHIENHMGIIYGNIQKEKRNKDLFLLTFELAQKARALHL
jgi:hypothetical protein